MSFDPLERSVSDEMSTDVVWLQPDGSALDALLMMERERVTALPVVDENECCVGILSAADLLKAARQLVELLNEISMTDEGPKRDGLISRLVQNSFSRAKVVDLIRKPPKNIASDSSILDAGQNMLRRRIHHLPVTNEQNQLVGIISTMDLLAAFVKAATDTEDQAS